MLTEDDVIEAVCSHLERSGYRIVQRCATTQRGEDIVAVHSSGVTLRIEAKGQTSNRPASRRFGKPFDNAQCHNHVAGAFYAAAAMRDAHGERVGLAFPDTKLHREHAARVKGALQQLAVAVFWVSADRSVAVESTRTV
jgi:hypothetical protein